MTYFANSEGLRYGSEDPAEGLVELNERGVRHVYENGLPRARWLDIGWTQLLHSLHPNLIVHSGRSPGAYRQNDSMQKICARK